MYQKEATMTLEVVMQYTEGSICCFISKLVHAEDPLGQFSS